MEAEPLRVDWIHLPAQTETLSLWESLHDGELSGIESNLIERIVRLKFDVPYLRSFHGLPDELRFVLQLEGVNSVRVLRWVAWPGEFSVPAGATYDEREKLRADYSSKCREESEAWGTFEAEVAGADGGPEVMSAEMAVGAGGNGVALRMQTMQNNSYREVIVSAQKLTIFSSDGDALGLPDFLQLGHRYWEAFSRRS